MTTLKKGDEAPRFEAKDQQGNTIRLQDYLGKKLVLFFYPKASTPGCTAEACDLRDNYQTFLSRGYDVLGVSADSAKRQENFKNKYELPFPLLADEDLKIHEQYGVWQLKKFMGKEFMGTIRTTFLIDENGKIKNIIQKPASKKHAEEVLAAWGE